MDQRLLRVNMIFNKRTASNGQTRARIELVYAKASTDKVGLGEGFAGQGGE
ncbi:MAG TPA: hypothetical protein VNR87_03910 [Flavisolibacter sp.]|nr:hypothetical protein [Flavisolibacter sp.]